MSDRLLSSTRARAAVPESDNRNRRSKYPYNDKIVASIDAGDFDKVPVYIQEKYGSMGIYHKSKKHPKRAVLIVNPKHLPPNSSTTKKFLEQVRDVCSLYVFYV